MWGGGGGGQWAEVCFFSRSNLINLLENNELVALTLFSEVSGFNHFGRWLAASINRNSPSVSYTLNGR